MGARVGHHNIMVGVVVRVAVGTNPAGVGVRVGTGVEEGRGLLGCSGVGEGWASGSGVTVAPGQ